jgi:hypothetical protein
MHAIAISLPFVGQLSVSRHRLPEGFSFDQQFDIDREDPRETVVRLQLGGWDWMASFMSWRWVQAERNGQWDAVETETGCHVGNRLHLS